MLMERIELAKARISATHPGKSREQDSMQVIKETVDQLSLVI